MSLTEGGPETVADFQLNVHNIKLLLGRPPRPFGALRFDSNNDCNVHCVYCHNPRSSGLIDREDFKTFLDDSVVGTEVFQIGCIMEPTLDERMCDFMHIVAQSPARPRSSFRLQTNGILLHRHDAGKMQAAGLTHLSVSVDSAATSTHKDLRGGTSLAKVERNLRTFHRSCPSVHIVFLTTVTSANIAGLRELIKWGLDVGATSFVFRQVFHHPTSRIVDHTRMESLLVSADAFAERRRAIIDEFGTHTTLSFLTSESLLMRGAQVRAASQGSLSAALPRLSG